MIFAGKGVSGRLANFDWAKDLLQAELQRRVSLLEWPGGSSGEDLERKCQTCIELGARPEDRMYSAKF